MASEGPAQEAAQKASVDFRHAAIRTLFSSAIAILFLLILMVAALQQQAASHLAATTGYTSAHAQVADIDRLRAEVAMRDKVLEASKAARHAIEDPLLKARAGLATSNTKVDLLAQAIKDADSCPAFARPPPADTALWGTVYQCWFAGTVPESVRADIKALAGSPDDPTQISNRIASYESELQRKQAEIVDLEAAVKAGREQLTRTGALAENMQDIVIFDRSVLGWLGLTWIPPATMQIVLSFVSGLFGSLLVTLVLAVYPNNDLHFTGSDSYWNRILLGGLIAVGVYIVIGGGIAVLSANSADPDGSTNFLSFCAIGMLAGMFSDKFAGWLSDNAQKLTARRDPEPKP